MIHSRSIYEYDLKTFFDSLNLDYLGSILESLQVPRALVHRIISWCRTLAQNFPIDSRLTWKDSYSEISDYKYHVTGEYELHSDRDYDYWHTQKLHAEIRSPQLSRNDYFHGVAQGRSKSPILSTLLLSKDLLFSPYASVLQYAVDGLLYNLKRDPLKDLNLSSWLGLCQAYSGIEVHPKKCGWVRQSGTWVRPLKFIGKFKHKTHKDRVEEKGLFKLLYFDCNFKEESHRRGVDTGRERSKVSEEKTVRRVGMAIT